MHHHKIARLMHDQYQVMSTLQKLVYLMAFEIFGIEESVFREQVDKEIRQYEIYRDLMHSDTPKAD